MNVKNWGEEWHEDMLRSGDNRCPECSDGTLGTPTIANVQKYIVGLDVGRDTYKVRAIFRCPKCGHSFWFHLDYIFATWVHEDMEER